MSLREKACTALANNSSMVVSPREVLDLIEKLQAAEAALFFISTGCLVPPDGGDPRFEDAITEAKEALRTIRGESK